MLSALYVVTRPSVRLSVTQVDQSKTVEVRIIAVHIFDPKNHLGICGVRCKYV